MDYKGAYQDYMSSNSPSYLTRAHWDLLHLAAIEWQSSLEESLYTRSGTVLGGLWWAVDMAHRCPLAARGYGANHKGPKCSCCTSLHTQGKSHAYSCWGSNMFSVCLL